MGPTTIEVQGLGKLYRLGQQQAAYGTLRDSLSSVLRRRGGGGSTRDLWALRDVDLSVREGEAVGLVGTNGAGKSTLLKILAKITEPSVGVARTRGRVGVMLEVGTGFHPELTGRENVFLSGAVMGMTRSDIRRHFDEIVTFAGVERFLETPLKRYSSGMKLRLAFAVAAHLEPELMLVDEILAVGDVEFQRRCLARMGSLREEGRTVIFVSHDLGAVTRLCSRAAWLDQGRVVRDGDPNDVVRDYYATLLGRSGHVEFDVDGPLGIRRAGLVDELGDALQQPARGEPLWIEAEVVAERAEPGVDIGIYLSGSDGAVILHEMWSDQARLPDLVPAAGTYRVRLRIPSLLRPGDYVVGMWLGTPHEDHFDREVMRFTLLPMTGDRQEALGRRRLVQPEVGWSREVMALADPVVAGGAA